MLLGPEFGKDKGRKAIVVAVYGLKSAGAAFRSHLADCMRQLWYKSNRSRPVDKGLYKGYWEWSWKVLFLHTYICRWHTLHTWWSQLSTHPNRQVFPAETCRWTGCILRGKVEANAAWERCMGVELKPIQVCTIGSAKQQEVCGRELAKVLQVDVLGAKSIPHRLQARTRYTSWITTWAHIVLSIPYGNRWMIELGRVDICTEVSMLSSHMALPHQGH